MRPSRLPSSAVFFRLDRRVSELARRMKTSRSAVDKLLDPGNGSVTLQTLQSATGALGGRLKVELDFQDRAACSPEP